MAEFPDFSKVNECPLHPEGFPLPIWDKRSRANLLIPPERLRGTEVDMQLVIFTEARDYSLIDLDQNGH